MTIVGNRIQVFPEVENGHFDNVIITYQIYNPTRQSRVLLLSSNGVGETLGCGILFPLILDISGVVVYTIL